MKGSSSVLFIVFYIMLCSVASHVRSTTDRITPSEPLSVGQSLISADEVFELGFFSPSNSSRQYVGIWYVSVTERRVVWVANRDSPLSVTDRAASLVISNDGNIRILDGNRSIVWSTNIIAPSNNTFAMLSDGGDLILHDIFTGTVLWESFDHPCDVFLASTVFGMNTKTGEERFLRSWTSEDDPSRGEFTVGLLPQPPVQFFIWKGSAKYWRSGPWNGLKFTGMLSTDSKYEENFALQQNIQEGTLYVACRRYNISYYSLMVITREGSLKIMKKENNEPWDVKWEVPNGACDTYGVCGPFGVCNSNKSPICECMKGFVPRLGDEWHKGNWTGGCMRQTELQCHNNVSGNLLSIGGQKDGFRKLSGVKLPDNYQHLNRIEDTEGCRNWCLSNCSCVAYAYVSGIRCLVWAGNLVDIHEFDGEDLYIRLAAADLGEDGGKLRVKLLISLTTSTAVIIVFIAFIAYKLKAKRRDSVRQFLTSERIPSHELSSKPLTQTDTSYLHAIGFEEIRVATDDFTEQNKIGEGGFGAVFKGRLKDGKEIAVKRHSGCTEQGIEDLENEALLISQLQHRNLVRVIGFCTEREEKLIVYEYHENKSLDTFIFDATRRVLLDWPTRSNVIHGVARGLLYLHSESRLRVIHRDLKASNILLDNQMNPKISDFGLARSFLETQTLANTHRVVGTYGYMAPEYAMKGIFSEKSDVYSFGVLLLEIISGKNCCKFFNDEQELNLLGEAWWLWNEEKELQLMDETLLNTYSAVEVQRCVHIGLLCVQEDPANRPAMSTVVVMLNSDDIVLPEPKQPEYSSQSSPGYASSVNEVTVSVCEGR